MSRLLRYVTILAVLICYTSSVAQWRHALGYGDRISHCAASIGPNGFVGTRDGLFLTTDQGMTWGMVSPTGLPSYSIRSLAVQGNDLFVLLGVNFRTIYEYEGVSNNAVYGHQGLYRVSESGTKWTPIDKSFPLDSLSEISVCGPFVCCRVGHRGIYRSSDGGDHWSLWPKFSKYTVFTGDESGEILLAGSAYPSISTDAGATWYELPFTPQNNGLDFLTAVHLVDTMLYVSVDRDLNGQRTGYTFRTSVANINAHRSNQPSDELWQESSSLRGHEVEHIMSLGHTVFALTTGDIYDPDASHEIWRTTDDGQTWTPLYKGLMMDRLTSVGVCGTDLYATGTGSIFRTKAFRSSDSGQSWNEVSRSLRAERALAFGAIRNAIVTCSKEGLLRSRDQGQSWEATGSGLKGPYVNTFFTSGAWIFAGSDSGAFVSTDEGTTWKESDVGLSGASISAFAQLGTKMFVGYTYRDLSNRLSGDIKSSTDGGASWQIGTSYIRAPITSLATKNDTLFAAGINWGPAYSADQGVTWHGGAGLGKVLSLSVTNDAIYAGTTNGVWRSTDDCTNWTNVTNNLAEFAVASITTDGKNLFLGTADSGAFFSTNRGAQWTRIPKDLDWSIYAPQGIPSLFSIFCNDGNLYAGTAMGIWTLPVSSIIGGSSSVSETTAPGIADVYPKPLLQLRIRWGLALHISTRTARKASLGIRATSRMAPTSRWCGAAARCSAWRSSWLIENHLTFAFGFRKLLWK
jgi:photosystem II stability/assembly factor-like uncharacterized protein